jgi:hypothetical protein
MQRIIDSPGTRWAATDLRRRSGLPTRSLTLLLIEPFASVYSHFMRNRDTIDAELRLLATVRRDIREAQVLIDRLQRRYLSGHERNQQRPAGGQSRAIVGLQAK